jgi:ADP-ribosylation factor-like protein 6
VVDSDDRLRVSVAQNELEMLLEHKSIKGRKLPMLFFANKSDMASCMPEQEVANEMHLDEITDRPWNIQASSATEGFGVDEGINWLSEQVKKNK